MRLNKIIEMLSFSSLSMASIDQDVATKILLIFQGLHPGYKYDLKSCV
ncbi:MAG: hypothetical protein WAT21_02960 [Saprospiraceae bacterium]